MGSVVGAALLGALLWQPDRIRDVMDWLTPEDFDHWVHQAVYTTLTDLVHAGLPIKLSLLPAQLAAHAVEPSLKRAHPAFIVATLLSGTPPHAAHGDAHLHYARLLLDVSIRRQLQEMGSRVQPLPLPPDPHPARLAETAQRLRSRLRELEPRLAALTARLTTAGLMDPRAFRPPVTGQTPAGGGAGPAAGNPVAEWALIGASLQSASVRELALGMLTDADFTNPACRVVWAAIRALSDRGVPVDYVMVVGELAHADPRVAPTPAQLMRLGSSLRSDGYTQLLQVVQHAVQRVAAEVHTALSAAGHDAATAAAAVATARRAVQTGRVAATRLSGPAAATTGSDMALPPRRAAPPRPTPRRGR